MVKPGVQLWSLKNDLQQDFKKTLQAVSGIGFTVAEGAGYDITTRTVFGRPPRQFVTELNDAGLHLLGMHAPVTLQNIKSLLPDFTAMDCKYLICSMYPDAGRTIDDYKRIAAAFNQIGAITQKAGILFGYHNHHFEFDAVNEQRPFDILLGYTDPSLVVFEIDLGWVVCAGADPVPYFGAHPGRFPLWHFRDVNANGQPADAGEGVVDFSELEPSKETAGFVQGIVETPSAATDGLARIARSFNNLVQGN